MVYRPQAKESDLEQDHGAPWLPKTSFKSTCSMKEWKDVEIVNDYNN
jgi:hypothetical protein